jgi:hypothetical protein
MRRNQNESIRLHIVILQDWLDTATSHLDFPSVPHHELTSGDYIGQDDQLAVLDVPSG